MPEYSTTYRGREVYVELDSQGYVLDIYPVKSGDKFVITESNKLAFEVDNYEKIIDVMEAFHAEMAENKRSHGRDRVGEE